MARFSSYSARSRRRRKAHSIYLIGAVVLFALVVYFFFFRGDSPARREAVAGESETSAVAAEEPTRETPAPVVETVATQEVAPVPQERTNLPLPGGPGQQVSTDPVVQPQTLPAPTPSPAPVPAAVEVQGSAEANRAVAQAMALLKSGPGQVIAARDKLNATLATKLSATQRRTVKAEMAKLSEQWLFGPSVLPGDALCSTYTVKRGDLLEIIGRRNKVPHEILMKINNIPRPESLQAGKAMKIINGPFHAKVSRSTFTLDLYLKDTYVRSFKVGLGRPGYETPTGLWRVQEGGKLIAPTWTDPDTQRVYKATDPDYPLGSRWIALDGVSGMAKGRTGFAIHGTKNPEQIGMAGSRGCIRMYNGECILMYNLLFPLYSKVEVFD